MKQFQTQIYETFPPFATCLYHPDTKPQDQNFLQMLRFTFFPYLQLYSFTFFWLVTILFVYIYSLYWDGSDGHKKIVQQQFLKVSQNTLFQLGQNYPYFIIQKYHYYRMLTSTVLFRNLYHFLISGIGITIFSSYVQQHVGFKRCFLLAVTGGVGGLLIRNVFNFKASIQSITPICGMIGYMLGLYIGNSDTKWKYYQKQKWHMLVVMLAVLGLYVQLGYYYRNISLLSMLAAVVIGFVFYFCDPLQKLAKWKVPSIILLFVIIGAAAFMFFFKSQPQQIVI